METALSNFTTLGRCEQRRPRVVGYCRNTCGLSGLAMTSALLLSAIQKPGEADVRIYLRKQSSIRRNQNRTVDPLRLEGGGCCTKPTKPIVTSILWHHPSNLLRRFALTLGEKLSKIFRFRSPLGALWILAELSVPMGKFCMR